MTSTLQQCVLSSDARSSLETSVFIEGPYAGHRATLQPLLVADTVLCLVGGIGITNALGYVQEYTSTNLHSGESSGKRQGMSNAKRFILVWSAKGKALIEHVRNNFLAQKDHVEGIEYEFWCTGSPTLLRKRWVPLMTKTRRPEA